MTEATRLYLNSQQRLAKLAARLRGEGIGARLARGALWSMGSAIINRGLGLIGAMLAARILGVEAFGEVGVAQQVVAMMGTLCGLSVAAASSRFIAESFRLSKDTAGRFLTATAYWSWGSAVVGAVALLVLSPWLAAQPLGSAALAPVLVASIPLLVLSLVAQAQTGALAGLESFRGIAVSNVWGGILGIPIQVAGAYYFGVNGYLVGLAAAEAIRWAVGRQELSKQMRLTGIQWKRPASIDFKKLFLFGFPTMLGSLVIGFVMIASFAIVAHAQDGYEQVGLFQATLQFRNILIFVSVQLSSSVIPVLASAYANGQSDEFSSGLRKIVRWSILSSVGTSAALGAVAPFAMGGFGEAFGQHWALLLILAVLTPIQAGNAVGGAVLSAINKPWLLFFGTLGFGALAIVLVLIAPTAQGLIISQGIGSIVPLAVIIRTLYRDYRG
jgi:O-antigen/teichoic acid export membrane protein